MDDKAFMAKSNPLALAGALGDDESASAQKATIQDGNDQKVYFYARKIDSSPRNAKRALN
jgi:hypothetical protein